jgi:PleD family two-component response regulator
VARGSLPGSQRFEESMAALAAQLAVKPITDKQSGGTSPVLTAVSEEANPPRKKLRRASPTAAATLLILDDDEDQIKLLCRTMEPTGYAATCFTSAEAALDALRWPAMARPILASFSSTNLSPHLI